MYKYITYGLVGILLAGASLSALTVFAHKTQRWSSYSNERHTISTLKHETTKKRRHGGGTTATTTPPTSTSTPPTATTTPPVATTTPPVATTTPPSTGTTTTTIPQGSGRILSVSPTGSDTADGVTAPVKTIQRAHDLAKAGDVIEVASGSYGGLQVRRFGTASAWITLRAKAGAEVTMRGTTNGPTIYFYNSGCDEYAPAGSVCKSAYWSIEGIKVMGSATGGSDGNAIKIDTPFVRLLGNKLCCSVADVIKAVRTANNVTIENNEIWQDASVTQFSSNAQGIDVTGADDLLVRGNYIHDVPNIAVYAKGNACRPIIEQNMLRNIGDSRNGNAIMLGQQTDANRLVQGCGDTTSPYYESYDGIVRNNIVIGATGACVGVSSSHNAKVYHNSCYDVAKLFHHAFIITNESVAPSRPGYPNGRQPSDHVEFRGNIVVNPTSGKMFGDSDLLSMEDWSQLIISDNIYWSAKPLVFTLKKTSMYSGGSFDKWKTTYTQLTGNTDNSRNVDPLVNTTTMALNAGSPALGTAPAGLVANDFTGALRSSTPSVGARE